MIRFDATALARIAPGGQLQVFERFAELEPFGVLAWKRRADHFLAQVLHETNGLTILVEGLSYSAKRLTQVWPKRFPSLQAAAPYADNPRALANKVYGGRMGNVDPDDGWRYIGRGLLQLTGRSAYRQIGAALGLDLEGFPMLVLEPEHCLRVAGAVWLEKRCNEFADVDSISQVTKAINGGLIGLEDRLSWLHMVRDFDVIVERPSDVSE